MANELMSGPLQPSTGYRLVVIFKVVNFFHIKSVFVFHQVTEILH